MASPARTPIAASRSRTGHLLGPIGTCRELSGPKQQFPPTVFPRALPAPNFCLQSPDQSRPFQTNPDQSRLRKLIDLAACKARMNFTRFFNVNYWLVKSEPESFSWSALVKEGKTAWTGVRNYAARLNLRAMKKGDPVLFYHSVSEKQVVGIARVVKEAYPDPTATEGDWSCVDLMPFKPLRNPVTLDTIKSDKTLENVPLLRQTRLSVMPFTRTEFERVLDLAGTPKPAAAPPR